MPKGKQLTEAEKAEREAERRAKFKELAAKRLANAQKAIDLLGNLAAYKPTETQVAFLKEKLAQSAQAAFARLEGQKSSASMVEIPD